MKREEVQLGLRVHVQSTRPELPLAHRDATGTVVVIEPSGQHVRVRVWLDQFNTSLWYWPHELNKLHSPRQS